MADGVSDSDDMIWIGGSPYGVVYQYDTRSGRVCQEFTLRGGADNAGGGVRCCGRFVAWYVNREGDGIVVQVGRERYPWDQDMRIVHRSYFGDVYATLFISRVGHRSIKLRCCSFETVV